MNGGTGNGPSGAPFQFGPNSTAAQPCGTCPNCGGTLYALLTHHCKTTALRGQTQVGSRDISLQRAAAEDALREYAEASKFWNAPDDEHTKWQIRRVAEDVITEMFGG